MNPFCLHVRAFERQILRNGSLKSQLGGQKDSQLFQS